MEWQIYDVRLAPCFCTALIWLICRRGVAAHLDCRARWSGGSRALSYRSSSPSSWPPARRGRGQIWRPPQPGEHYFCGSGEEEHSEALVAECCHPLGLAVLLVDFSVWVIFVCLCLPFLNSPSCVIAAASSLSLFTFMVVHVSVKAGVIEGANCQGVKGENLLNANTHQWPTVASISNHSYLNKR